jgi:hypothetical protein
MYHFSIPPTQIKLCLSSQLHELWWSVPVLRVSIWARSLYLNCLHLNTRTFNTRKYHFQSRSSVFCDWNSLSRGLHYLLQVGFPSSSWQSVLEGSQIRLAVVIGCYKNWANGRFHNIPSAYSLHSLFLAIKSNWYLGTSRFNRIGHSRRGSRKILVHFKWQSRKAMSFLFFLLLLRHSLTFYRNLSSV